MGLEQVRNVISPGLAIARRKAASALPRTPPIDFTVEHEEGHVLGALDEGRKFVADFGHSSGHHMINPDDVPNSIIPAALATVFNKGFAAKR
jgi:hypothetical protein